MASLLNADDGVVSGSAGLKSTADSSGVLALQTNGTTAITVNASQNVGIGTASPSYKLDVNGTISVPNLYDNSGSVRFKYSGANAASRDWRIVNDIANYGDFGIQQSTTQGGSTFDTKLMFSSTGNLGLGLAPNTWSSGKVLEIGNSGSAFWGNSPANVYITENAYYNSGWKYGATAGAAAYQLVQNSHIWYNAPSGTAGNAITFTQAMTLDASGNLAVGITSAARRFEISGLSSGESFQMRIGAGSTNSAYTYDIGRSTVDGYLAFWGNQSGNNGYIFGGANGERARIDLSGNLLVGTTSANNAKFAVNTVPNSVIGTQSAFISGSKAGYAGIAQLPQGQLFVYDTNTTAGSGGAISFGGDAGGGQQTWYAAIEARKDNSTSGDYGGSMVFYTRPSGATAGERARITSGGVFLINQTTLSVAGAGNKCQIATDLLTTGLSAGYFWENRSGGVTTNSNWYGWYTTSGTIYLYNGGGNIASINTSSGAYTALSDVNKKKDFEDSNIGLSAVMQLKPKLFRMLGDADETAKQLGFVAQDVKDVIPQAYVEQSVVDAGNNDATYIGLNDRPIIAALTKAIQEQQALIQQLQADVAILKGSQQ